jgi:hypothetical protein
MELRYRSGDVVRKDDRVRYAGGEAVVEFVADPDLSGPETDYFTDEFGGGCMILTERFGRVFVDAPQDDEALEFVSRGQN